MWIWLIACSWGTRPSVATGWDIPTQRCVKCWECWIKTVCRLWWPENQSNPIWGLQNQHLDVFKIWGPPIMDLKKSPEFFRTSNLMWKIQEVLFFQSVLEVDLRRLIPMMFSVGKRGWGQIIGRSPKWRSILGLAKVDATKGSIDLWHLMNLNDIECHLPYNPGWSFVFMLPSDCSKPIKELRLFASLCQA